MRGPEARILARFLLRGRPFRALLGTGETVSAVMAEGRHPVPFRTRKLSSSAPMVLRGGPRGRVGRRRTCLKRVAPNMVERPSSLVWVVLKLEVGKRG